MNADRRPPAHQTDGDGPPRLDVDGRGWVHLPVATPEAVAAIEPGTAVPTVVLDILQGPPPRPQRTAVEGWTIWSLRPVELGADRASVHAAHLVIAVGPRVVLTGGRLPEAAAERIDDRRGDHAEAPAAPDVIVAGIVGDVLDDVGGVIARLDDEVEDIEEAVFSPARASHAARIHRLKREVQTVRRSIGPLPELLASGPTGRAATTDGERHTGELSAHARRLVEQLTHVDELLDGILAAHLAQVTVQQNDDMRRISAWVAIVAAPTAMASIYGMNFRHMPELGWRFGYPLVLATMVVICLVLYRLFRRSGWL